MKIDEQKKVIEALRGAALRAKYREVVGQETRSNNRPFLIKKILEALQAMPPTAEPKEVETPRSSKGKRVSTPKAKIERQGRRERARDPRLPGPGAVLERECDGKTIRAKVLEQGFECRGRPYRSLSTLVKEETGTIWNPFLFFKLSPYPRRLRKPSPDA